MMVSVVGLGALIIAIADCTGVLLDEIGVFRAVQANSNTDGGEALLLEIHVDLALDNLARDKRKNVSLQLNKDLAAMEALLSFQIFL